MHQVILADCNLLIDRKRNCMSNDSVHWLIMSLIITGLSTLLYYGPCSHLWMQKLMMIHGKK